MAFQGLTGRIQFKEGSRSNIKWDLLKLRQTELDKVGEWTTTGGLNVTKPEAFHEFGGANITLKVTTIEVRKDRKTGRKIFGERILTPRRYAFVDGSFTGSDMI